MPIDNPSIEISIRRIKEWNHSYPQLHNDALKVVRYLEHLVAVQDGDITNDPEYLAFVADQAKHCHCTMGCQPCDGVLAGGMCDDLHEENVFGDC